MSEILIQTLKKLKDINPSEDFQGRSLPLILSAPQNQRTYLPNLFTAFQFSGALVLASILIFVIFGGTDKLNWRSPSGQLTGLDADNLNAELNDLNLKIKLAEVRYTENPLDQTSVVLLNETETENKAVDDLLKELTF